MKPLDGLLLIAMSQVSLLAGQLLLSQSQSKTSSPLRYLPLLVSGASLTFVLGRLLVVSLYS